MQRKKVLFLITKSNWGGAQRYVYDLATHLDQTEYEPVVVLGGSGELSTLLAHAGIRVISIDSLQRDLSLSAEWRFITELWHILRKEKPVVFHVNSSKAGAVGTLLGRLARIRRVIFTAHGWAFNEDRPWWQKTIIKTIHWATVLLSHQTIAVSGAIVKQMNWPFAAKKMKIINPGRTIGVMYTRSEAREKLIELHTQLSEYRNDPWVITIAELHPIKRIPILIEAMRKISATAPQLRSIIIGDGELKDSLQQTITRNHLNKTVFLLGSVTEAARFLKAGDIFVLPSKSESYGYVLHEAGLAHVPVIATNTGGITDIIQDGRSGKLITPDDPTALADQLLAFTQDQQTWKQYADTLQINMQKRSVERMTEATSLLY